MQSVAFRYLLLLAPMRIARHRGKQEGLRGRARTCAGRSYRLCVYGYVVMPEHIHLLRSEPERETLAVAIKSLKQGVARRLIGSAEHFWQKRYYDFNVRNHQQFEEKVELPHSSQKKA